MRNYPFIGVLSAQVGRTAEPVRVGRRPHAAPRVFVGSVAIRQAADEHARRGKRARHAVFGQIQGRLWGRGVIMDGSVNT